MRAHDWDKGSLYSFRAMSFPAQLPYASIAPPVLIVTGEKDRMLTQSAKQVGCQQEREREGESVSEPATHCA